jgi:hypothetical protein
MPSRFSFRLDAVVFAVAYQTPAADDEQESDALSDLRPLASAIAAVHAYPGAAFAGVG